MVAFESFQKSSFQMNKQNCCIWGTENPHAYIEKKAHWVIFLRKWTRRDRYSQWRSLLGHVERIFVHKNWRGRYWQHLVSTGRPYVPHRQSCTRCFTPRFWRSHYQPQRWCRLTTSELRFDTVGLLFVGFRQRKVLRRQVTDNWSFKWQY